jgi:ubiquitin carboxyl-terminal hydrolase 7
LVHSGDVSGGHYCAFIKPTKQGKWLKFDDDRVVPVTDKEVYEDNFGGDVVPLARQRPGIRTIKRFTNAYMLVYIRESEIDTVLCPVTESDVPDHISKSFCDLIEHELKIHIARDINQEKAALEARRKEQREQHLYLNIKVLTDEHIRQHQGFDLGNFDDPSYELTKCSSFRVPKEETLGQFKVSFSFSFIFQLGNDSYF